MIERIRALPNVGTPNRALFGRPKVVLQCEFATVDHNRRSIVSSGFNSCVVVAFKSDSHGGIAHLDVRTDIKRSFSEVVFPRLGGNLLSYKALLFGGIRGVSDLLASGIISELKLAGIRVDRKGLFHEGGYMGLLLDGQDGRITPLNSRLNLKGIAAAQRFDENIRYISDNPDQRIIRFVEA